ncbi:MAG TPA: EAL domain-containing protein [Mycobacteriales bacterium]|nr:EAL domain-containing protein [Mycobacteriales bacterium]
MTRTKTATPSRLIAYLLLLGALTLGGVAVEVRLGHQALPSWWRCVIVTGIVALAESRLSTMPMGRSRWSVTFSEVAIIVSFLLAPGAWVAVFGGAGLLVTLAIHRRQLVKAVANQLALMSGVLVAQLVVGRPWEDPRHLHAAQLGRLVLGGIAFGMWTGLALSIAIGLHSRGPLLAALRNKLLVTTVVTVGNSVGAGLVIALGVWSASTLVVVPPMLALAYLFYWVSLHAREESELWQRLEVASAAVASLDEAEIIEQAEAHASTLVGAKHARLLLTPEEMGVVRVENTATITVRVDGQRDTSAVVIPLDGPNGPLGRLVLTFDGKVQLKERERRVLGTLARAICASLERSRLYAETRSLAERKAHEAAHDGLTGLANRTLLHDRLEMAVAMGPTALLLIDLDHFKTINDTLGHTVGDRLLVEVGRRLAAGSEPADTVARLGGDEFAVLIVGADAPVRAEARSASLLRLLAETIDVDGMRLAVGASVGLACSPEDATDVEELFQRADVAMYQAKATRGGMQRYREDRDDSSITRLELVAELRAGLDRGELQMHYQPQVDVVLGTINAFEALARWKHPTRGFLPPSDFIPAVEQSGLLPVFTSRVLDQAIHDCAAWAAEGSVVSVAVNLSARDLLDRRLPKVVADALARHHLPAERLILEITETTAMSELEVVEHVLSDLRRLGVQLSVDDFGTGYSSLAFLQRVRVNELKVDKSFVADLLSCESDAAIVRATIELAHSLGLRCVAEGVESPELLVALAQLGCDVAQGYHLGRPADFATTRVRLGLTEPLNLPIQRAGELPAMVEVPPTITVS